MSNKPYSHIGRQLLPCIIFSALTGFFAALIITVFKILAELAVHASVSAYEAVRANPILLPILVLGAALLGLAASFIITKSPDCKGGGIPSSVAAIQGILSFRWVAGVLLLPVSALLTFLAGLPLGTEGPCVQMGTAVGDGVVQCLGREKHRGWRRYIMTGGAAAGFSIATASPISAIIFSMEELHKRFSPIILSVASVSVITAQFTARALAALGIGELGLFQPSELPVLPANLFFAPILLGIVSGLCSVLYTRLYHHAEGMMRKALGKLPVKIVFPVIFAVIAVIGFFLAGTLGSGHSLINSLFTENTVWYLLVLVLLIRAAGMVACNTVGATGGLFLPTLAFGAIMGSLFASAVISLGWIGEEHYVLLVVLGTVSFLGATSRIPLTACVFAIEALGGIDNILPIVITTVISLIIIESSGLEDMTDKLIETRLHKVSGVNPPLEVEVPLTVKPSSFAVGKRLKSLLWPGGCIVLGFDGGEHSDGHALISEGDVITVRYKTHDPAATVKELTDLVGEQEGDTLRAMVPD